MSDSDVSQMVSDLGKIVEKLKETIPPHKPDRSSTEALLTADPRFMSRFGIPFTNGKSESEFERGGADFGEADEHKKEEERQAAARAAARAERDQRLAALGGDLAAIRSQMGDEQFFQLTTDCWHATGAGALLGGPEGAMIVLLGSPDCRKMFIESYKRIVIQMGTRATPERTRTERERFERMDRNHYEAERFDRLSRTA